MSWKLNKGHFINALRRTLFLLNLIPVALISNLSPFANGSTQCNLGLKLFSMESGNAICAPIADFHCIELCEWVDADKGGCTLSSHYTAFRGRRTFLTGLVFTEGSFLVQCCASLATSVLVDAELEPICRWSEIIETVVDKPSVRFNLPLGEHEYFRDLRGMRTGRGGAKIQTEICRYVVQRTNCDRKKMSPEDAHQYSLLLLRLQRTREFFQNANGGGILNTGGSSPTTQIERGRARAEHRTLYKNTTQSEQLGFIQRDMEESPLERVGKFLESAIVENGAIVAEGRVLVDGMSYRDNNNKEKAAEMENSKNNEIQSTTTTTSTQQPTESISSTSSYQAPPPPSTKNMDPVLYNLPRHYNTLWAKYQQQKQKQQPNNMRGQVIASAGADSADDANGGEEKARMLRELFYRAAKQGSALLKRLNTHEQNISSANDNGDINGTTPGNIIMAHSGGGAFGAGRPLAIRRLRPFPREQQEQPDTPPLQNGPQSVRMLQMSRLGWPKGLRRRQWPVVANTNTTRELLIPTRGDHHLNWVDNNMEFFDSVTRNGRLRHGTAGSLMKQNLPPIQLDKIRPRIVEEERNEANNQRQQQMVRIKKLKRKNFVNNNNDDRREERNQQQQFQQQQQQWEQRRFMEIERERKKILAPPFDEEMILQQQIASTVGGGGSFASTEEPTFFPPAPIEFRPFDPNINNGGGGGIGGTSPLGRAPQFKVVPFLEKDPSHQSPPQQQQLPWANNKRKPPGPIRDGQVRFPAENIGGGGAQDGSQLGKLLECCQQQAPGCRTLCTREVSKEQIKLAMASGQCPPLSMTSVLQCFPRFYNITSVSHCCAESTLQSAGPFLQQQPFGLPAQCLNLCTADFHLSFAHFACIEHSELILGCYRQLLDKTERSIRRNQEEGQQFFEEGALPPFAAA